MIINIPIKTKKTGNYLCFYDSEFNAYDDNTQLDIPQEVISIGICIIDLKGNLIDKYYSLIKLKAASKITKRCTGITGIKTSDLKDAPTFNKVINNILKKVKEYGIDEIYCYGLEDKRMLQKTIDIYKDKGNALKILKMLKDVRPDLKKRTKGKVGDQGLQFLKLICGYEEKVSHNALDDAIDLANVHRHIYNVGFNEKLFNELTKEREEISTYKRSRNIKPEHSINCSSDIIKNKDKLVEFLEKHHIPNMNDGLKRAIIDDLNLLFKE